VTEVSTRLRAARERAGLTIGDLSASTKIRPSSLAAIERGDFASLPGDFYTRAFLRTYASHVGLSPLAVVAEYESERPPAQPAPIGNHANGDAIRYAVSRALSVATSTGVVIALVVGLLAVAIARRPAAPRQAEPGAVGTSGTGVATPSPARSSGTTPPAPAPAAPQQLIIDIQAAAPMWVTGAADGRRVLYRLLAPGERVTVKAADTLAFRVGDASAFTYSINGRPGKTLGGAGEVRDVEITRANYSTFAR
jgi:cytoskeletal protein RodZ